MNKTISFPLPGTLEDPRYPDSNGRFMGDTEFHNIAITLLMEALRDFFGNRPDVYVAANLVFYWKEGDARRRRDPDVLVAKGTAGNYKRRSYRLWEEKKVPQVLFEIASRRTWRNDLFKKPKLYMGIDVKEYFLFDPEGRYLDPVLQGFKRVKGKPVPLKPAQDGSLVSKELGLKLIPEGDMLRLIDLASGEPILTRAERAEKEKQRAEQEHYRADEAEKRAANLAAEVERLHQLLKQRGE